VDERRDLAQDVHLEPHLVGEVVVEIRIRGIRLEGAARLRDRPVDEPEVELDHPHRGGIELAAVLLLVAIIVAIALTLRKRKDTKYQDPAKQAVVKRSERVRLVSMQSEKKE